MNTNTSSADQPTGPAGGCLNDDLAALAAVVDRLATRDLDRLTDPVLAERVLGLRRLLDCLEGQWLKELAAVDARGAAGAEAAVEAGSTAGWLRARLRLGAGAASGAVRTARTLFRGPLAATAEAVCDGEISPAHARVLASGTYDLPEHVTADAEPVLLAAAGRLDPPRLRRVLGHLQQVADPDRAEAERERRHGRRGLWLAPTLDGMVAVDGLLEAEAGQTLMAALDPLARPADATDARSGSQRTADALAELARRSLEQGRLPQSGGVRPQLLVTVDLDSLLGHPRALGGAVGEAGPLAPEACQRLACDGTVTRVLVTRHHRGHHDRIGPLQEGLAAPAPGRDGTPATQDPSHPPDPGHHPPNPGHPPYPDRGRHPSPGGGTAMGMGEQLRAAMTLLPPTLGGAPTQPLEVGRTSRVVTPAQRVALAVRDNGCVFPDCTRPLGWCEAHHLRHWLHGGPTDLANLALLCRAHHRAVHEGGWRLARHSDGRLTATPPHRQPHRPPHRQRQPTAA